MRTNRSASVTAATARYPAAVASRSPSRA
jgi:hypothetical protein